MGDILFKASNMICTKHRNVPRSFGLMPTKNVLVGATSNSWRTVALLGNIVSPRADGKYN